MEMQEIEVIRELMKLAPLLPIWIFMSCYSMKKDFDHFRGYEKYGLWKNWSILRVVVPCEDP